jgi:hypothetical protein
MQNGCQGRMKHFRMKPPVKKKEEGEQGCPENKFILYLAAFLFLAIIRWAYLFDSRYLHKGRKILFLPQTDDKRSLERAINNNNRPFWLDLDENVWVSVCVYTGNHMGMELMHWSVAAFSGKI